jgi:hypothetical protein
VLGLQSCQGRHKGVKLLPHKCLSRAERAVLLQACSRLPVAQPPLHRLRPATQAASVVWRPLLMALAALAALALPRRMEARLAAWVSPEDTQRACNGSP